MSAQVGLGLLDGLGDIHVGGVDSTDHDFCLKASLVHLANRYTVPLSRGQDFLKNLLVPLDRRSLDEVHTTILGLDLRDASGLELTDDERIERIQLLCECIKFSLQAKALVDEGGQFGCCLVGCHGSHFTVGVYQHQIDKGCDVGHRVA